MFAAALLKAAWKAVWLLMEVLPSGLRWQVSLASFASMPLNMRNTKCFAVCWSSWFTVRGSGSILLSKAMAAFARWRMYGKAKYVTTA
ncbi:hypothetical protein NPIL_250971 [Nephila pilipes]|uniref:Secreted protein n=1 Tax=Nephila pilipes TaxID=299642 RepID=A0A8X6T3Y2_NEPPI|nr:hypothetical protein NPIL_250971 [Nephila pilipes]